YRVFPQRMVAAYRHRRPGAGGGARGRNRRRAPRMAADPDQVALDRRRGHVPGGRPSGRPVRRVPGRRPGADRPVLTGRATPAAHPSLSYHAWTRNHLILATLQDVRRRLAVLTPADGPWQRAELPGVPEFAHADLVDTDPYDSDEYMLETTGFTEPGTLRYGH